MYPYFIFLELGGGSSKNGRFDLTATQTLKLTNKIEISYVADRRIKGSISTKEPWPRMNTYEDPVAGGWWDEAVFETSAVRVDCPVIKVQ